MKLKTTPVQPVRVERVCDACDIGTMERTTGGAQLLSNPPQYEHTCTHCGVSAWYRGETYPRIEYREPAMAVGVTASVFSTDGGQG